MKRIWKAKSKIAGDLLTSLLSNRGLENPKEIASFLNSRFEESLDPSLLKDMEQALERIKEAFEAHEKIVIFADYDADAVTAAAVLMRFLRHIGHQKVDYYIPDRFTEGYGINSEAVRTLAQRGTNLIITVDCGINAFEAITVARELGVDVIVTDHHEPLGVIPPALAVVNPHRLDDAYPFKDLTGVGVAFKLVQALVKKFGIKRGWEKWLLDLVAIGTVADCQSLLGENRIFVKWGILVLQKTKWPGLKTLLETAGIWGESLDTYKIGFVIAPRINAAGRIEHAGLALELLLTDDEEQAADLTRKLEDLNRHRQELTAQILSEAREQLAASLDKKILLAVGKNWPKGIVGLVAGKLTEEFYRPVLVLEKGERESTGSARSIGNFNIVQAISKSSSLLVKYGGHAMAAGFTILSEHIESFHNNLLEHAEKVLRDDDLSPQLYYEAEISLPDVTEGLLATLKKFAPFGLGNPKPRFRINNLGAKFISTAGTDGKHLRMTVEANGQSFGCIGFNLGFWADKLAGREQKIDIICEPQHNEWNGQRKIQLKIIDLDFHNS